MPVYKCPNGKWRIGSGPCMYKTKEAAEKAYRAYRAKKGNSSMKEKIFTETVTFGSAHSLILGHKPEGISMEQLYHKMEEDEHEIQKFGLFERATPNYTTYYPDVTEEDLAPKDSEFIEPVFRLLSNVTVHANWNPIHFPVDVLKASMYKLIGKTVNIDHEFAVGNAIGVIKSVEWQNGYTTNGVKVPAGINGVMKIDGKANPRIARGIMMDPPSIHSDSVTVQFAWKKSHPNLSDEEFFSKLGSFDEKGKLIQKIATDVLNYHEVSLVSHGADPFAQRIKDGKINNANYAKDRYSLSDQTIDSNNERNSTIWVDLKQLSEIPHEENINLDDNQNPEIMEEFLSFLDELLGLETGTLTEENYQEKVKEWKKAQETALVEAQKPVKVEDLEGIEAIQNEIITLREKVKDLPDDARDQIKLAKTGKVIVQELREDTKRLYTLNAGEGKTDASILAVIEASDYQTLKALHKQYGDAVEKTFEMTCGDCGSHNISRASANPAEEGEKHIPKTDEELIDHFTGVSKVVLPKQLQFLEK